jgi:hypothetical protein
MDKMERVLPISAFEKLQNLLLYLEKEHVGLFRIVRTVTG